GPEEDPADYPAGGDMMIMSHMMYDDDDFEVKRMGDEEEEEHLAIADPSAIPTDDPLHTISSCFLRPNPCSTKCRRHLIPNPKPRSRDTSLVALGKSAIKFARQKSYADVRRKPVKFQVDNLVMLKGLERVESIAYSLRSAELSRVHNTFHISNLKKCCSDDPLAIPLEGLHIDDKFHLVEEPVVIMDRDIKRLKSKPYPNC
ncbi:hypothetical protein Tco_0168331, partial [Tanacetum coccineum]